MRIIWGICILLAMAGSTFFVIRSVSEYTNYETISQHRVIKEKNIKFPSVFICPIREIQLEKFIVRCKFDSSEINCKNYIQRVKITNNLGESKICYKINGGM